MSYIINSINAINSEAVVKNIMCATAILGSAIMILMLVAGTISIMQRGWASQETSTCGAIALCAGMLVFFACNYISMH